MKLFFPLLTAMSVFPALAEAEDQIHFNRDIRPILSDKCFYCHGFDEKNRKADLRLDTFEGATEDLGGTRAVVPHEVDASELVHRILSTDPDDLMPPPETEQELTDAERDLLVRWVEQGAKYEEHWAWEPLARPEAPQGKTGPAAVDAFIEAGWKAESAEPVGLATPRERLRRLSFDLRGIPPTMEEVEAFEKTPDDETFFAFRDQWMSELAYAEHQALYWLDLVRWADTSGFVSDEPIASGAYRAWIVESFLTNQPFDEFSIEQLAGDLLPNPTDDQLIASGYNRIVNTNCEAGAIETEQLYKLKGEHVRALGTVWMGMTTGCAECHDHKFDPISAKDYYSLAAFFDDLVEAGVYTPGDRREPLHYVHGEAAASKRDRDLSHQIDALKAEIALTKTDGIAAWESTMIEQLKNTKDRRDFTWVPAQLPAPRVLEGSFEVSNLDGKPARVTSSDSGELVRHHAAEFMTGYLYHQKQKTDEKKDAWFVEVWIDPENPPAMIGLQISQGDYGRLGWRTDNYETYYWGDDATGTLAKPQPWSDPKRAKRLGDLPDKTGWVCLRVPASDWIKPISGQSFESVGMVWMHSGGRVGWGASGMELREDKAAELELGETTIRRWWEKPKNRQVYQRRLEYVSKAILTAPEKRDALQQEIVEAAFRERVNPQGLAKLRTLESELHLHRAEAMPVLVSRQDEERKVTRVLNRGDFNDESGEVVSPAIPEFLGALNTDGTATRLDLARWLFEEDNPLTARVFVNRMWYQFFGRGLSETLEDSGTQGDWPSHLPLLDWLAAEFRDSGWNRNHLVRLLTSTKVYQLSSVPTPELTEQDPANRWHARQSRHRLTAEAIRDSALLSAGLLTETKSIPKQSFFPYQPDAYWSRSDKVMFGSRHLKWATSEKAGQYHRSLYTFWKRQNIHPTMLAFDAPTRQECTPKRNVTNTPGQALALLNDPMFVEAARGLAERITRSEKDDEARLQAAFHHVLQREPSTEELGILSSLLESQRSIYREKPEDASAFLAIGQHQPSKDVETTELAAWTTVTRAILNLHEFVTRS